MSAPQWAQGPVREELYYDARNDSFRCIQTYAVRQYAPHVSNWLYGLLPGMRVQMSFPLLRL